MTQLRLALAVLFVATIVSCGPAAPSAGTSPTLSAGASASAGPTKGGVLRIGYGAEVDNLNAFTSQFLTDIELTMVEGLIVSNDKNEYIPVLAKQVPTVANGLVKTRADGKLELTWPLQQGVMWHDQVHEFTAEDVCFTWKYVVSTGSEVYNRNSYLPISDCRVQDKYTAVMVWDKPSAIYNGLFEAILPKYMLEGKDIVKYDGYNRSPVGTGPFIFSEWKAGEYVRVKRNPNYWRGTQYPYADEVVFRFIPDINTRLNAVKSGEVDFAQMTPTQVKDVKDLPNFNLTLVQQNSWQHFDMSIKTERGAKIFSDKNVRTALFQLIDKKTIVDGVLEGTVQVADTVAPTTSPFYNPNVKKYTYDPTAAKKLLDDAGWKVGADGIREKAGEKLSLTALLSSADAIGKLYWQVIQQNMKSAGVDIKIDTKDAAARSQVWRSGQWELQISRWVLPADPSVTGLYSCKGSNNMTGFCDAAMDEQMVKSDEELDPAKRKAYLFKAQELLAENAFSLPIYYNVNPIVTSKKLGNFKASGTNLGSFWNVFEWYLNK
jgi:peptide/nickel transport system substrate-binding protein